MWFVSRFIHLGHLVCHKMRVVQMSLCEIRASCESSVWRVISDSSVG
jgi:hypothetical protein